MPFVSSTDCLNRNGITSTHLGFIKRGHIIVLCFAISPDLPLQLEIADITFAVSDNKPCIVVICSDTIDTGSPGPFPTIVQAAGYSPPALETAAALVFGENLHPQLADRVNPLGPIFGNLGYGQLISGTRQEIYLGFWICGQSA